MFQRSSKAFSAVFLLLAPFAVEACYFWLSRITGRASPASDTIGIVVSIAVGSGTLFLRRLSFRAYLLLLPVYVALMGFAVFVFAFAFVCSAFGDCL